MGIITSKLRKETATGEATRDELIAHHCYGDEILADGFISPLVLPNDRLRELRGEESVGEMADRCHIATRTLQILFDYDYLEPTARQLMSISSAYNVSVLWLLGYHTTKERHLNGGDAAILSVIAKRNAAEATQYRLPDKGAFRDFYASIIAKRLHKWNLQVSNTAARIIAMEHLALTDSELYAMNGQPVFLEYEPSGTEWGIISQDTILTPTKTLDIANNGESFKAYQTPKTAVATF